MRRIVIAGVAAASLAALGTGIPSVMAGVHSAPRTEIPSGWPADKVSGLEAENQPREQAAGRPVVAPDDEGPAGQSSGTQRADGPSAVQGPSAQRQDGQQGSQQAGQFTAGIVPLTAGGPFSQADFTGTNLWNGPVDGQWEVVQAGATTTGEAGLFVYTRSADPTSSAAPKVAGVRTPPGSPAGTFTIERASGDVLTLARSGSGSSGTGAAPRQYTFDVSTLRFTS